MKYINIQRNKASMFWRGPGTKKAARPEEWNDGVDVFHNAIQESLTCRKS